MAEQLDEPTAKALRDTLISVDPAYAQKLADCQYDELAEARRIMLRWITAQPETIEWQEVDISKLQC